MSEAEAEALKALASIEGRERKKYIELHLRNLIKASWEVLPARIVRDLNKSSKN